MIKEGDDPMIRSANLEHLHKAIDVMAGQPVAKRPVAGPHEHVVDILGIPYHVRFWTDEEWAAERDKPRKAIPCRNGGYAHYRAIREAI
jgi:hypothetical protein